MTSNGRRIRKPTTCEVCRGHSWAGRVCRTCKRRLDPATAPPAKKHYRTIVIDPPWTGPGAVPAFNQDGPYLMPYTTMTGVQVAALQIDDIATDDAQLWLWATTRSLGDAYLLLPAWSFKYRALFVWKKPLGLGRHVRHQCEFLLWGARKKAKLNDPKKTPKQLHEWPRPPRHSEKPAEAYEMIADLSDGPRLDIFARQTRPGFDAFGNQAGRLDDPAAAA